MSAPPIDWCEPDNLGRFIEMLGEEPGATFDRLAARWKVSRGTIGSLAARLIEAGCDDERFVAWRKRFDVRRKNRPGRTLRGALEVLKTRAAAVAQRRAA